MTTLQDKIILVTGATGKQGGATEVLQNKNLTDLAKKHNSQHFVFASIARCDDNPNLAHFVTKYECEKYIQNSGLPFTFLRAVYFMDNLRPNEQYASFHWSVLSDILGAKTTLQMISTSDIGWFAANAFLHPEQYKNKTLDIAGDEITYPQLLNAYKKVFNAEPKKSNFLKFIGIFMEPELKKMFHWYREPRFKADIKHLKTIHPSLTNIEEYFRQVKNAE